MSTEQAASAGSSRGLGILLAALGSLIGSTLAVVALGMTGRFVKAEVLLLLGLAALVLCVLATASLALTAHAGTRRRGGGPTQVAPVPRLEPGRLNGGYAAGGAAGPPQPWYREAEQSAPVRRATRQPSTVLPPAKPSDGQRPSLLTLWPDGVRTTGNSSTQPNSSSGTRTPVPPTAQCPRCGDFHLAPTNVAGGVRFECRACGHEWTWAPGTLGPMTTVRPHPVRRSRRNPDPTPQ